MNKQTGYLVIAFLLGVIATQYFLRSGSKVSKEIVNLGSTNVENTVESTLPSPRHNLRTLTIQKTGKVSTEDFAAGASLKKLNPPVATARPEVTVIQTKKRIVELTLDEKNIIELEQNLGELADKVVIHREDRGWRVNYLTTDNPMIQVGLQNNDLVLYDLIDTAKNNSRTGPLVSRLESIFTSLQR